MGQPLDNEGRPIPVLYPVPGLARNGSFTAAVRLGPFNVFTRAVEIDVEGDAYIRFGDSSVVAVDGTDNFVRGKSARPYSIGPRGATDVYLSLVSAGGLSNTYHVTELQ